MLPRSTKTTRYRYRNRAGGSRNTTSTKYHPDHGGSGHKLISRREIMTEARPVVPNRSQCCTTRTLSCSEAMSLAQTVGVVVVLSVLLYNMLAVLFIPSSEMQPHGSLAQLNTSCVVGEKMSLFVGDASWDLDLTQRYDGGLLYAR